MPKRGFLFINLGTPQSLSYFDLYRFLAEFLSDWRVLDIPAFIRYPLVYGFIAPLRPWKIRRGYKKIWDKQSPLLAHSLDLIEALKKQTQAPIALGMTYQKPSIDEALQELQAAGCEEIVALPLFPQYACASTGASFGALYESCAQLQDPPSLITIKDFHTNPGYINSQTALIQKHLPKKCDLLVFSFHGVPVRQLIKSGCSQAPECQNQECPINHPAFCYRAQCFNTARAIAAQLNPQPKFTIAFQSRLGPVPWIKPYLDQSLEGWFNEGVRHLMIVSASFTADCLETLEEINTEIRHEWEQRTKDTGSFSSVPCLNAHQVWVDTLVEWINKMQSLDMSL